MNVDYEKETWRLFLTPANRNRPISSLIKSKKINVLEVLAHNEVETEALFERDIPEINKILIQKGLFLDKYRYHPSEDIRWAVAKTGHYSLAFLTDECLFVAEEANHQITDKELVPISVLKQMKYPMADYFFQKEYAFSLIDHIEDYTKPIQRALVTSHTEIAQLFQWSPKYYEEIVEEFVHDKETMTQLFYRYLTYLKEQHPTIPNVEQAFEDSKVLQECYKLGLSTNQTPFPYRSLNTKEEWEQALRIPGNDYKLKNMKHLPAQLHSFLKANQQFDLVDANKTCQLFIEPILRLPEELFAFYKEAVAKFAFERHNEHILRFHKKELIERGIKLEYFLEKAKEEKDIFDLLMGIGYRLDVLATYRRNHQSNYRQLVTNWKYGYEEKQPYYVYKNTEDVMENWEIDEWVLATHTCAIIRKKMEVVKPLERRKDLFHKNSMVIESMNVDKVLEWQHNELEPLHFPFHQDSKDAYTLMPRRLFLRQRNKKALFYLQLSQEIE